MSAECRILDLFRAEFQNVDRTSVPFRLDGWGCLASERVRLGIKVKIKIFSECAIGRGLTNGPFV